MDVGELKTYVVSYTTPVEGEVHKRVKACPKTLLEKSKRAFNLNGEYALEEFNKEYDLYIRVDDAQDIQGQGRFRLVRCTGATSGSAGDAASPAVLLPSFSTASTVSAAYILPSVGAPSPIIVSEEVEEFLSSTSVGNTSSAPDVGNVVQDITFVEESSSAGLLAPTSVASAASSGGNAVGASRGWFEPSCLSRRVADALTSKEKLKTHEWKEITDLIYACYTQEEKSDEPSRSDYSKMAGTVLKRYPHLCGHLNMDEAVKWLKRVIRDKFKNKRRDDRTKSCCNNSAAGRTTGKRPPGRPRSEAKRRKVDGFPYYAPEAKKSTFDVEIDKNKLRSAGEDELDGLMDETFPARRHAIVHDHAAVTELMEDYAPLFTSDQFWKELERMSERKEYKQWALTALKEWKGKIASALKGSPETALKQVTAALKENWLTDLTEPSDKSPHLQRKPDGTFSVWVEHQMCYNFGDADDAVLGFVLCHSIFNCAFPKRYKGVGSFIQRYVLGIEDGVPVPDKTLGFVQRLK